MVFKLSEKKATEILKELKKEAERVEVEAQKIERRIYSLL